MLLDELSSAPRGVQAAAYKLILDRQVGDKHLHENVVMMACGNLSTDGAIVNPLSTALQSRMVHFELEFDVDAWLDWASKEQVDPRITGFLNWKPNKIHDFNPNHNDKTYPCGRTWEFLHDIINDWDTISHTKLPILCGTVGQGAGHEFYAFCQVYANLPSIDVLLANPETVHIDTSNKSVLFALCSVIEHNITTDNAAAMMKLVKRLDVEFQVVCLMRCIAHKATIGTHPEVLKWVTENSSRLRGV